MPVQEEETKKPAKKKKVAEVDPEVLEAEKQARLKAEDIEKYGRTWIWEGFYDETSDELMKCWPEGVLGLRDLNMHVLEDLEDYILLQGFNKMGNTDIQKRIDENILERRQRQHMIMLEAAKEADTEEHK